jgi:FkbM family methyltransferase
MITTNPWTPEITRANRVYTSLKNELFASSIIYVGGTSAIGEAKFICSIFDNVIFIDDFNINKTFFGRDIISTNDFSKSFTKKDFLINTCNSYKGHSHFLKLSLSTEIPYCTAVELFSSVLDDYSVVSIPSQTTVYGPSFHKHTFENIENYLLLRSIFTDKLSLHTFDHLIRYRLTGDPNHLREISVGYHEGIYGYHSYVLNSEFFNFNDDEFFIDGGAFDGMSTDKFVRAVNGNFRRVVMFEPYTENSLNCKLLISKLDSEYVYKNIQSKIAVEEKALFSHSGEVEFTPTLFDISTTLEHGLMPQSGHIVETGLSSTFLNKESAYEINKIRTTTLDDFIGKDRITFIKLEIEGSEVDALSGATNSILINRPKMALSIYHRPQDLQLIINYVLSLNLNYKVALRAHNPLCPDAIVLYCW